MTLRPGATVQEIMRELAPQGLVQAASHVETLAAADIVNGQDTGRDITLFPDTAGSGVDVLVVSGIQAQGIKPNNLVITARDVNRSAFRLFLDPALRVVEGLPLVGRPAEGVVLTVRNSAARPVDLLVQTLGAPVIRVETSNLPVAALPTGPGGGNSLYNSSPGDGTWAEAPDAAAVATVTPPFTASTFTVLVDNAAVEIRISSDGSNYGDWIVLQPGAWPFNITMESVQVREDVDGGGARYQVVSWA